MQGRPGAVNASALRWRQARSAAVPGASSMRWRKLILVFSVGSMALVLLSLNVKFMMDAAQKLSASGTTSLGGELDRGALDDLAIRPQENLNTGSDNKEASLKDSVNDNSSDSWIQKDDEIDNSGLKSRHSGGLRGSTTTTTTTKTTSAKSNSFPPFPVSTKDSELFGSDREQALEMCERTLWHTLKTTTVVLPNDETFIFTGDIDDLWLRDSAAQIHPLLVPWASGGKALVAQDPALERIVSGLIRRSAFYIRHDPYANAFRIDDTYTFSKRQKQLGRHDFISTWNYELDSACYFLRMLWFFWKAVPHNPVLKILEVKQAVDIMVDLWIAEQDHEANSYPKGPLFDCLNCNKPYRYPELTRSGKGPRTARTGMTWSGFRPSDDACVYGYLVPANMFAVVVLKYVAEMAPVLWAEHGGSALALKAERLAKEIDEGIKTHAIVEHKEFGRIYAFEVNGMPGVAKRELLMDDANVPNLISAPYLGYEVDPQVYANTRRFILSEQNPTYRKGSNDDTGEIEGFGSPHMAHNIRDNIWPMAIAVQALTSSDEAEKVLLVQKLMQSTGGTGWMHESFDVHSPKRFTRKWFCWADALFAELVMSLTSACPKRPLSYNVLRVTDPNFPPS